MTEPATVPKFPMADAAGRIMGRRHFGVPLIVMGLLFVAMGAAIAIDPGIVVYIVALAFVGFGILTLAMAMFLRKMAREFRSMRRES